MKFITIRFLSISLICILGSIAQAQYFSGKITYKQSFESKSEELTDEVLTEYMGDNFEYFHSNGNYKTIINGIFSTTTIYLRNSNKVFSYPNTKDSLTILDASEYDGTLIDYKVNKRKELILGIWCDELVMHTSKSTIKYYYSSELKVDADIYANHKYSYWDKYTEMAGSLPLKYIMEFDEFVTTGVATKVENYEIDDSMFELPEDLVKNE